MSRVSDDEKWLKEHYSVEIPLEKFVKIGKTLRGNEFECSMTQKRVGGMNVALTLQFEDGVEWIAKAPKLVTEATMGRLKSEVATMKFLATFGNLPVPHLHDFSLTEVIQ